jgi:hypothetical protein
MQMPRRGGRHYVLVKGAEEAMEHFKMEIASDLGLGSKLGAGTDMFKKMTTEEVGQIGGTMVRRIQAAGEFAIMQRYQQGEKRLMPDNILPEAENIRDVSNNGREVPNTVIN